MESKRQSKTRNLAGQRSRVTVKVVERTLDHAESRMDSGFPKNSAGIDARPLDMQRSSVSSEFLTVVEAAKLLGIHAATIRNNCKNGKYPGAEKRPINGGQGWLIPISSVLTPSQHAKYLKEKQQALNADAPTVPADGAPKAATEMVVDTRDAEYRQLWDRFERKDGNFKHMAEEALGVLLAYLELKESGVSVGYAEDAIKASHGAARSTIRRYLDFTRNHPRQHWLPLLCPQYHGGRGRAPFTQAAYDFILALKVKSPGTKLRVLIRAAMKEGAGKGWLLPSEDTIAKRLKEEPAWMFGGMAALERGFPTVERDYASLELHQCWESDGRKADVFCIWPDGTVNRPFVIAIREVRTRKVLSIRICHAPDAEAVLGAYGAALVHAQAIPAFFKLDNGREYANKAFTGHQKTRYRNKFAVDEAVGILTAMSVKVSWSKPGQGRDKPIESWWNVIAENCDKAPEFAGAYCGKDVLSKPEDFDKKKAVPVESYAVKLIQTITEWEARPHRGQGMKGRAPLEVYGELGETTITRKPDPSEIRRCKMGVVSLSLDKKDSSLRFKMKGYDMPMKYWAEELADLSVSEREGKFNVYYDWGEPNSPVAVYRGDAFICDAKPQGRIDFIESRDGEKVGAHMQAKGKHIQQRKKAINAAKAGGSVALPDGGSGLTLPPLVAPNQALVIAPSTKPRQVAAPLSPIHAIPGRPGESVDEETGEVFFGVAAKRAQAEEKRKQEEQETEAELEEMKRRQRERNLPAYLR